MLATGHHARVGRVDGAPRLLRGVDRSKDQSYVLSVLGPDELGRVVLPVGELTKPAVRARARALGLRTADKPDSQDVCFIHGATGRRGFLSERTALHCAELVDASSGAVVGTVPAAELVTVGQRRGLGVSVDGRRRYALRVDVAARRVTVGDAAQATTTRVPVGVARWSGPPLAAGDRAWAQTSAHGAPARCTWTDGAVVFDAPHPLVAPGQTLALYDDGDPDTVVGAAVAEVGVPEGGAGGSMAVAAPDVRVAG